MKNNLIQSNGPMSVSRYKNALMISEEDDNMFESAQYGVNEGTR